MKTAMPSPMIEARGLTRRFGALTAVDGLDLRIPKGEIYGLVGPDGAGKTTTLRLFCGLLDPHAGAALLDGVNPARNPHAVRDRIGYMPQRFGLYEDLSVEENLFFYAEIYGVLGSGRDGLMAELLRMTRMEPFRKRLAGKLSGGMKQKLALMSTLLHRPDVLFLDEPTNGVDPVSRRDFWEILYRLVRDGLTVLLTTAYLDEAERCNRVGLLYKGRLIREDAPQEIRSRMERFCYTIACGDPPRARELLAARPDVLSAEFSAGTLRVFVQENGAAGAEIARVLEASGQSDVSVRQALPSLEEVFIALVRQAESGELRAPAGGTR